MTCLGILIVQGGIGYDEMNPNSEVLSPFHILRVSDLNSYPVGNPRPTIGTSISPPQPEKETILAIQPSNPPAHAKNHRPLSSVHYSTTILETPNPLPSHLTATQNVVFWDRYV